MANMYKDTQLVSDSFI